MRVYLVMGNDYPDAVFSTEEAAEAHCERRRAEEKARYLKERGRERPSHDLGIYWRVNGFTVDAELENA